MILAHDLDQATADRLQAAITADGADGALDLATEATRVEPQVGGAPNTSLAAQLLGFVNHDGVGQYGIEQYYQDVLAGQPKVVLAARSISGRPLVDSAQVVDPGTPGQDITLTIDDNLQLAVEQEVMAASVADNALSVSAVVIDPKTGQVYAEASYPSYDANNYATTPAANFVDPVVSDAYEPGSVFKMLTALAALQAGTITPTTTVYDSGSLSLDHGTARIYDSDKRAMGRIPFENVLAYSRNVGAARVALGLASTTNAAAGVLKATWDKLGIGRPTGIDLANEASGTVHDPTIQPWHQVDLANAAFGQGVAATLIQLASAYSAMVNGGYLVTPHVVAAIGNRPGRSHARRPGHLADDRGDPDQPDDLHRPYRAVVRRQDPGQGLRRGRQDRYGPDLGPNPQPRPRWLDDDPLQQHVRRIHRSERAGPGDRRPDPRGQAARSSARATCPWPSSHTSCSGGLPPIR